MGGCESKESIEVSHRSEPKRNSYFITALGSTSTQNLIIGFQKTEFEAITSNIPIPRFCNALLQSATIGFITGGIEDLQANADSRATLTQQIFQGSISKKFLRVKMETFLRNPSKSLQSLPEMINSRYAHGAVELDGCLYVIGGRQYGGDENGLLSACEKFDFGRNKWITVPSLQYARSAASVVVYGKHIYVFGGYSGQNSRTRVIESFIDGDNSWRKLPFNLHLGLEGMLVLKKPKSESSVLIFGGRTDHDKSRSVMELNFDRSTIQSVGTMKEGRCFHKAKCQEDQVWIFGGGCEYVENFNLQIGKSQLLKDVSHLNVCTVNQFQEQITLKYTKRNREMAGFPNSVYIFGHAAEPFAKVVNTDNLVVLSTGMRLEHNFSQFTTVCRVNKEHSFVLGGIDIDFTSVSNQVYSFNFKTEQIQYLEPMETARYAFPAVVKGSYLYVIGGRKIGEDEVAIIGLCQRFSFQTYAWEAISPMKHRRQSAIVEVANNVLVVIGGYKSTGSRINQIEVYIEDENRWVEVDVHFDLAVEAMSTGHFQGGIYLFGGRAQQSQVQKVFKLQLDVDEGLKHEKCVSLKLEPVGQLSKAGTNLRVFVNSEGLAYIFGNIPGGIDIYDIRKNKIVQTEQLSVFEALQDKLFQSYTFIF